jgi:hypothetical protein
MRETLIAIAGLQRREISRMINNMISIVSLSMQLSVPLFVFSIIDHESMNEIVIKHLSLVIFLGVEGGGEANPIS